MIVGWANNILFKNVHTYVLYIEFQDSSWSHSGSVTDFQIIFYFSLNILYDCGKKCKQDRKNKYWSNKVTRHQYLEITNINTQLTWFQIYLYVVQGKRNLWECVFKKIKIFTFCLNLIEEKETNAKIEGLIKLLLTLFTI